MIIRNYAKVAYRNILKNKLYSLINIFGLAIGMAACFFIFQYVYFESGYDRFNKNADRIYRIPIAYSGSFSNVPTTAANHPALGPAMKKEFPEVEAFTRVVHPSIFFNSTTFSHKDKNGNNTVFNNDRTYVVDSSFFTVFTYMFSRDFVKLVLLASVIAIPVIYFAADSWLMNYAFRMKLS